VNAPLPTLTAAFFAGRLVSYSLYVGAASAAAASLGSLVADSLSSPLGIALQLLMLASVVALLRIDWVGLLNKHSPSRPAIEREPERRTGPLEAQSQER
jgi:hypothetical protein